MEPRGQELIERYKENYGIPAEAPVTEQMILAHWELEKQLTAELLRSTPENRWETFERCYTRLYAELDWLNRYVDRARTQPPAERFARWTEAIGAPPKSIYEIGSGAGDLISYLARSGFECKGTEITRERGEKRLAQAPASLSWGVSDGVHLERFEAGEAYDLVLSDQVIEHLHPDDLPAHFEGAFSILKPGGRYIFCTPHRYTGPHDVSLVFGLERSRGMHLREYTYRELINAAKRAGFAKVSCASLPRKLQRLLAPLGATHAARARTFAKMYLLLQSTAEAILATIPSRRLRRRAARALTRTNLFADSIFLAAEKGTSGR